MRSTIKKLPESKVQLEVSLSKEELQDFAREAEKKLANEIRIKGFRAGKVPKELVRQQMGEQKIKEEALSIAVQSSFADVVKKEKLDVISQTDFKIKENTPEQLVYGMTLSIFPEVVLGKYTGLNIKKNQVAVVETEVDEAVDQLVKMRTTAEVADRPASTGDKVEVDFEIHSDGKMIEGGKSENHPLVIGEKKFIPGFEDQIIGMAAGEKKVFSIKVPADYPQKEISGKEVQINLTLKKVEQLKPPLLDDKFAQGLGRFSTLKDLKENLRQSLILEKEDKEKERVRLLILNEIISKSTMEVPTVLVEERLNSMIRDFDEELHTKGMELGLYLAHIKKTQDDLRKDWRSWAQTQVKMSLAARAIARQESLVISEQEIDQEFALLVDNYTRQGLLEELQKSDPIAIKARIRDVLINEKVFDFLEKNNLTV